MQSVIASRYRFGKIGPSLKPRQSPPGSLLYSVVASTTMPDSYQDRLKRVRPPRVKIDYKVETEGAEPITELPFIVGVMGDLSGMPPEGAKKAMKQRKFIEVDRDNFNRVMAQQQPR